MRAYILFTYSKSTPSKAIRAITGEPVSHTAIYVPDTGNVYHADFDGVYALSYEDFVKDNTIKYLVFTQVDVDKLRSRVSGPKKLYDYGAFAFLGLNLTWYRLTGRPISKTNLWSSTGMYICTEFVTDVLMDTEKSMLTPYGLFKYMTTDKPQK